MDTVSFTTGFALGLSRGGGGSTSLLQEFIANSKKLKEIPIDNQYHCAVHAISVNPTNYPTIVPVTAVRSFDITPAQISTNVNCLGIQMFRNSLYFYIVTYDNNAPICAQYLNNGWWYNPNFNTAVDQSGKLAVFPDGVADIDIDSLTVSAAELSFWKSGLSRFAFEFYDTSAPSSNIQITGTYKFYDYNIYYDSSNVPYAVLSGQPSVNQFSAYLNRDVTLGYAGNVYADMPYDQLIEKYREIYVAINAANGVTVPEAYWGRVYNERPE